MPTVKIRDLDVYYTDTGTGSPILWLPGTGLRGSSWHRQLTRFSPHHRCIAPDLRGSGETTGPGLDFTVADLADDAAALLDALGAGPAHVVGLSLGSAIAQELALRHPGQVRSAVLLSTWTSTAREHHIRRHFESRIYALDNGPLDVFAQFAFWMSAPSVIDDEPELQTEVEAELATHTSQRPDGTAAHFRADLHHETRDRLGDIHCPTLVLYGTEDLITLPIYNRIAAERIPGARLQTIPRAGHLAWLERTAEVNKHIAEFLGSVE